MKRIMIEQIIRKLLFEQPVQSAGVKKLQTVTVIIKPGLSSSNWSEAREAKAVAGFRVKAIAKKDVSKEKIDQAIAQRINQNSDLQTYLNGNYLFVRSEDQRDSQRNYLYNYWIFPKDYIQDIMWVYKPDITRVQSSDYNKTLGLPSQGVSDVMIFNNAIPLKSNTPNLQVNEIIKLVNLQPASKIIDKPYVDPKRYAKAYDWINQLKTINGKVDTTDLINPIKLKDIPDQITITENDAIPIQLYTKSIWGINIGDFAGEFDVRKSTPLNGTFIGGGAEDTQEYKFNGTFKSTDERSKISSAGDTGETTYSVIYNVDFVNGTAENLPVQLNIKTGFRTNLDNNKPTHTYTGTIRNGKLDDGKLMKIDSDEYFKGTFKNNKPLNGYDFIKNIPTTEYRFGVPGTYEVYTGMLNNQDAEADINILQLEMIDMFKFNSEFFNSEIFGNSIKNSIKQFVDRGPTGEWDSLMETISEFINITAFFLLLQKNYDASIETNQRRFVEIPAKVHEWIIQHKTKKIKLPEQQK